MLDVRLESSYLTPAPASSVNRQLPITRVRGPRQRQAQIRDFQSVDDAFNDHLGSVAGIYNARGEYIGGYTYSPDGQARFTGTSPDMVNNPMRYIGEYYMGAGFYKFGARYYDTDQYRFTQMDPSGQETGSSRTRV